MRIIHFIAALLFCLAVTAQVSEAFNYQGLLLNAGGNGIENKIVDFQISIYDAPSGLLYYTELQTVETHENGIFNFIIGEGTLVEGGLDEIDWFYSVPYIEVSYDLERDGSFISLGLQEFNAMPFCFYSKYISCLKGIDGEDGAVGPQGSSGPQGAQGAQGPQGATGQAGPSGISGLPILPLLSAPPANPAEGTIYMDNGNNRADQTPGLRYYDGSFWEDL